MSKSEERTVDVTLTYDEALVLFAWSHRQEDERYKGKFFIDKAEQVAVWNITASLENLIDEVFSPTYGNAVDAAKRRLVGETGMKPAKL